MFKIILIKSENEFTFRVQLVGTYGNELEGRGFNKSAASEKLEERINQWIEGLEAIKEEIKEL